MWPGIQEINTDAIYHHHEDHVGIGGGQGHEEVGA